MADDVGKVGLGIEIDQGGIGKQVNSIARDIGSRFSKALKTSMQGVMRGAKASTKAMPVPEVDTSKAQAEMEQLTAVLDNTNARIEIQQRKLSELQQSYQNAFSETRKNKLHEDILKTEAAILRLTKQSDNTSQKIWKLEDSLNEARQAASKVPPPVNNLGKRLKNVNKTINTTDRRLKSTSKNAGLVGAAFVATGKRASKMGNQFTQGFRRIAKQVLIFTVMYKAIRTFQQFMGSALSTNDEFSKSLNEVRTNLRVAFQPIFDAILPALNALMKTLARVTAYVATFMSAMFGNTYKQSLEAAKGLDANRKAMDDYGKSAKKASGQLAGFDELNVLHQPDESDAAGTGADDFKMEMPDMDVDHIQTKMDALALSVRTTFDRTWRGIQSGWQWATSTFGPGLQNAWSVMQPELGKWREQFGLMFSDILTLGEPFKNWWQNDLLPLWEQGVFNAASVISGLSESVRNVFDSIWEAASPIIDKFVTDGLPIISEFATSVQDVFMDMFDVVKTVFDDIWRDVIDPVMQLISQIVRDALDILFGWWDEWGKDILANIRESLNGIRQLWGNLWQKLLRPIVTKMLDTLTKLWNDHLRDLLKEIGNFIGKIIKAAQDIFNKFILPIVNWLVKILGPIVAEVFDGVMSVVGTALGSIIDAAKGIIKALGGIVDFIAGVFTADWKRAWNGIVTFMDGIGDAIVGVFKGAVNMIIDALNFFIRNANKVSFDIPDWVPGLGGKKFGINIPQIPKLAQGGIVTAPTLAMVGDNPHANVDPEVVSPLSKLQEMLGGSNQEVVEALYMIIQLLQDFTRRPVILEANGTQLAKAVDNARDDRNRRAGRTISPA